MVSDTEWFTKKKTKKGKDKFQLNSGIIYRDLSSEIVEKLDNNLSVSEIIDWIKNTTKEAFSAKYGKEPTGGALNNAAGRWNEFIATSLLSEIVFDMNLKSKACIAIFSLPNSRLQTENSNELSSKFLSLFNKDEFAPGKVLAKYKNQIFLPSPDYIIVSISNLDTLTSVQRLLEQQAKTPDSLELYKFFKGKLRLEDVKAAASLKTSNRPDRRYQPLFEAAMIKAMGYLLQQSWQYYMVASELSSADRTIFNTAVTPHSIALEQNFKLVDGTYLYHRKADLVPLVEAAIKN